MGRLSESSKSHSVTAEIVVPATGAEGVIVAQGGNIGSWSLYAKGGKLKYCYNLLGIQQFYVESSSALPPGDHQVRMEFAYAGGGLGKGGTAYYTSMEKRSARARSAPQRPWSFPPTMVATWGRTRDLLCHRTTGRAETGFRAGSRAFSSPCR
jgi:hypothetical protein